MVAGARASLQAKGHDPTRVREGTMTDLSPWSDVSFDLVMRLGVLSYVPIADQPQELPQKRTGCSNPEVP